MKAARQYSIRYKEQWEELNILHLGLLTEHTIKFIFESARKINIMVNILLFIAYQTMKFSLLFIISIMTAEAKVQIEREEQWIYRQIK